MREIVPPLIPDRIATQSGTGGGISRAAAAHLLHFDEIWIVDFEFVSKPGCRPDPVCLVAKEAFTARTIRLWRDQLQHLDHAPWHTGPRSVTVAYFASADLGCFRVLGWPDPVNVIDLFCEFRTHTNGLPLPLGRGLLGALAYYGLSGMSSGEKESMRGLIMSGGPWTPEEKVAILDYCAEDVDATIHLLDAMAPLLSAHPYRMGHAVIRGRYMAAVGAIEHTGIPIDVPTLELLIARWPDIQDALIQEIDRDFGVYDGRTFKADRFAGWLARTGTPWPRLDSGQLALDDNTFRSMAKAHPTVSPLRELRHALGQMRLNDIPVGPDGRNRTLISPFRSKTGRNQPSNSQFLFGTAVWLRGLIKPAEGMALAYLDIACQEIAIAACLSRDAAMWKAYDSGDPYMQFAIDAGLAPPGATEDTHQDIRYRCKKTMLAVQYGVGAHGLAAAAGIMVAEARQLLLHHREMYRDFWNWTETTVARGLLGGTFTTPFGWQYRLGHGTEPNVRSLMNWAMQSGGSDMLRLACIGITNAGIRICAPVHDALLIEASVEHIDEAVEIARQEIITASSLVLGGPACRVTCRADKDVYRYPDRYMDVKRGLTMWNRTMSLIGGPIHKPSGGQK